MTQNTPYQRAELLLQETGKRLHDIEKLNLHTPEAKAQIEWLEARRFEIKNILNFAAETQFQEEANNRILPLEKDPWDAGLHNAYVKIRKPKTQP